MQRLVYTPRAYAFIKDRNGAIRDVSRYITAGSVNRRINAVSTAELTLRNPKMIFTTPQPDGGVAFYPMDPITIYLKRAPGHPVRVFTGFLDKTPYLQLYPGTVTLRASCTLKRLLHTYFDPALPYTHSFLASYGWIPDGTGQWFSLQARNEMDLDGDPTTRDYRDGTLGQLLMETLHHIGGWAYDQVYIEALPSDLMDRMSDLAKSFVEDSEDARKAFKDLLETFIGDSEYGDGDSSGGNVSTGRVKGDERIVKTITEIANKRNIPPEMAVATWIIEWRGTGNKDSPGNPHYGYFQWDNKDGPPGSYAAYGVTRSKKNGCYDLGFAADCYAEAAQGVARRFPGIKNDTLAWTSKVQGVNQGELNNPGYPQKWPDLIRQAREMISKYASDRAEPNEQNETANENRQRAGDSDKDSGGNSNKRSYPLPKKYKASGSYLDDRGRGGDYRHAGEDYSAPIGTPVYAAHAGKVSHQSQGSGGYGTYIDLTGGGVTTRYAHLSAYVTEDGKSVEAGDLIGRVGSTGGSSGPHLHFEVRGSPGPSGSWRDTVDPKKWLEGAANPSGGEDADAGDGGGGGGGDALPASRAAALFGAFEVADLMAQAESIALAGEKSLMNDKPLFPFIEQLCEASLRQFQSLPDGKIYCFYPDYFGEMGHHEAYWMIDDIEILGGEIELSDDALITHYFVVGDTTFANDALGNRMFSSGVVSVFNAFLSTGMLSHNESDTPDAKLLERGEAVQFLQRYGARPFIDEMPMIKHPYFEFFLAYQRFLLAWSKQFLTPFTFTFMPELFPGGKVGFPDHALQVYIDEVTHTWDYESGFTTQANLSAPSVLKRGSPAAARLPENMVVAITDPVRKDKPEENPPENAPSQGRPNRPPRRPVPTLTPGPPEEEDRRYKDTTRANEGTPRDGG